MSRTVLVKGVGAMGSALRLRSLLMASVAVATGSPALAQSQADAGPSRTSADTSSGAEAADYNADIVVTASKRSENLSNVGSSITALSGDKLSELGLTSFQDFTRLTPGVSFQSVTPGRTQVSIRGINVGTTQPSSSVAIYLDEVPLTAAATSALSGELNADFDTFDLERIEVLKGPQGTLYGANALGGVIKYVPKGPLFDRVAAAGSLNVGSVHKGGTDYGMKGMVNLPLADWAALRLVGYYRKDAGYIDNVATGEADVNHAINRGGRAILELRPTDELTIKLTALAQRLTTGGESSVDAIAGTLTPAFGDLTQRRELPESVRDRFDLYNGVISYDFGFATLLASSSWTKQRFDRQISEVSHTPGTRDLFRLAGTNKKFVQEIRLQSASAEGKGLEWQIGGYYVNERYNRRLGFPTIDVATLQPLNDPGSGTIANYEEKAVFGNATYYFSPAFDLAAGVRYSENEQEGIGLNSGGQFNGRAGASNDSKVTWTATGRFRPAEQVLLYANISTGYRAGGPNFFAIGQAIPPEFAPEKLTNYEAGIKINLPSDRLTFNLAGFFIDWSSIQLPLIVNGLTFRGNSGTAESKGIELSSNYEPLDGLRFGATLSYTDAKITSDERTGVGAVPGERMAGTPRWSGSLTADYEHELSGALKGFVGATFTFSSNRPNSYRLSVNTPYMMIPGYETLGLRVGIDHDDWRLTLAADNLFDKRGITDDYTYERYAGIRFGGLGSYYDQLGVIRPRTLRLTFDFDF